VATSDNEDEGSSEGGVPCAAPSDDHIVPAMNVGIVRAPPTNNLMTSNPTILDEGSRVLVAYKGALYKATIRRHRVKSGKHDYLIHYDGNKNSTVNWIPVDHIKMDNLVEPSSKDNLFEPSSNDESTNVAPSLSAHEQVESESNDSDEESDNDNDDDDDYEDQDDDDNEEEDVEDVKDHEDDEDDKGNKDKEDHNDEITSEDNKDDEDQEDDNVGAFSNEVEQGVPGAYTDQKIAYLNQTPTYRCSIIENEKIDLLIKKTTRDEVEGGKWWKGVWFRHQLDAQKRSDWKTQNW